MNEKNAVNSLVPCAIRRPGFTRVPLSKIVDFDSTTAAMLAAVQDAGPPKFVAVAETHSTRHSGGTGGEKISREALMYLFYMSPILVVKCGDKYQCLGGFHTLNLARSFDLSRKGKVPAIVLPQEMPGSERRAITLVDLLVKSAIDSHAWLEPRVLAITWECCREIDEKLLVRLVPGAASRRGLARLRGVSYRTIFPRLVKNGESEVSQ